MLDLEVSPEGKAYNADRYNSCEHLEGIPESTFLRVNSWLPTSNTAEDYNNN
jgi:hypothetical protein